MAQRRLTSVLFADLVGFTPLSESRDPEEVRELLSVYFERCRTVVQRYGGTVEKFIGDALVSLHGTPVAHEDDAERAVRAALDLVDTVRALGVEVGIPELAVRVGVVTGEVAVTVGASGQGMVAGDPVNTAARIQATASAGQVLVDDTTRSLTASSITFDDAGEHALKGKSEPVRLWRAAAVVADVGGGQRIDGLEAPLTGRDAEMRLLKELFHGSADTGRPRLVVVDGEPGSGKTRLGWEFEKYIDGLADTVAWHRGRCLSYGEGAAFRALSDAVRSRLGLTETDPPDAVAEALHLRLPDWVADPEDRDWIGPRLAVLLGVGDDRQYPREDLFTAWTAFLARVGNGKPVVLLVEDGEHADDGLLDFLEHLLTTAHGSLFVLLLARPELLRRRPDLGGRRAAVLRLEPLDEAAMSALVDGLVAGLPKEARAGLVRVADGVPLFAVETVRALIDRDAVIPREGRYVAAADISTHLPAVETPASLHALIAARLDMLTADERRVVDDAAVLGLTFTLSGLTVLTPPSLDVDAVLGALRRKEILELITDRYSTEVGQHRFRHSLIRQVAYAGQSKRDRKRRHLAVADTLSAEPDPAGALSVVIAQHLLDALDSAGMNDPDVEALTDRACRELERAARRARTLGALTDALRLSQAALTRCRRPEDRARLLLAASENADGAGDLEAASRFAEQAVAAFRDLADADGEALAIAQLSWARLALLDSATALALAEDCWARRHKPSLSSRTRLALAQQLAIVCSERGDLAAAGVYAEEAILLAEATHDLDGLTRALNTAAARLQRLGAPITAMALYGAAADLARQHGAYRQLARALISRAVLQSSYDVTAALATFPEAEEAVNRAGLSYYRDGCIANNALTLWLAGQLRVCEQRVSDATGAVSDPGMLLLITTVALWLAEATDAPTASGRAGEVDPDDESSLAWAAARRMALRGTADTEMLPWADACIDHQIAGSGLSDDFPHLWPAAFRVAIQAGDLLRAQRYLDPVEAAAPESLSPIVAAELHHHRGLLTAARGDDPELAENELSEAIRAFDDFGAVGFAARTHEDLGHWLRGQGRHHQADEHLQTARKTYAEMGATGWLRRLNEKAPAADDATGGALNATYHRDRP